jgi:hypothetical protein
VSERRHSDNPLLQIEEIRRFPLRGARIPPAGTAFVFRSRTGRLSNPAGGYTAGEMLWHGPLVLFQVDLAPHPVVLRWVLPGEPGRDRVLVELSGRWTVRDPVATVAHRVSDAPAVCLAAAREAAGEIEPDHLAESQAALARRLAGPLDLPEGLRLDRLRPRLRRVAAQDAAGLVRSLLAGDEDPAMVSDEDLTARWRSARELARAGLTATGTAWPDEQVRSTVTAALTRFAEMTDRLAGHLPGEREGDGRAGR